MILDHLPEWVPYVGVGLSALLYLFAGIAWLSHKKTHADSSINVTGNAVIGDNANVHIGDIHNHGTATSFMSPSKGPENWEKKYGRAFDPERDMPED